MKNLQAVVWLPEEVFFHINSYGGAEPCFDSPYSYINVRDTSLLKALDSKFSNHFGLIIFF
ncbi:hypothetical protein [Methanobrevibacter sp.]|uniref:hypothetical protein n=1 Tax=Methanobrevibacter sp. TaxID=66852 RepID=UPI00388DD526